ncbi:NlpC/P60 family protein [Amycolatopsis sp. CA-230715]|uniref:NlpC/P60 family protein n=1 Tax=Amycolatopsis sp. CA-230715 TaxID=2745196 RepID=UPI001C034032|nr:NlpC/P60 family protein [Amycolatopsis sp. CA-230715]QWF78155.1 hypothetical protein HUW46_01550 [Amycolatopsis sp. CA-230715]
MQSQPVKRVVSGALAAGAVIAAVSIVQSPATAVPAPAPQTPPPADSGDALAKYRDLAAKAERLNEDYLKAQDDLKAKQGDLDKAGADVEAAKKSGEDAKVNEQRYRVDVDKFADASFTGGAPLNKLSALLTGTSTQDFLDRSSALEILASEKNAALGRLSGAVKQAADAQALATDAQGRAQAARDAAAKLTEDIAAQKKVLDDQKADLEKTSNSLSAAQKASQKDTGGAMPDIKNAGPAAAAAIQAAQSKLGSAYVWGATGPSTFDCSGLTMWAYKQAGITIPRSSRAQSTFGTPVDRSQLQPGDLVFYYSPVSHVGIYIGDGKMIHAPTSGDVVKISPLQSQYSGARRVA